ncbi:aldehyde dehydrogenase family protein [Siminovitchia fortis]|uniref:Aldehyde dehydrogenase family protein n=1 Tax=Siminovitchia fortis TaxID=254758 RepID=A0A443IME9_9BACI|nr:aldehyde dehydrogenase family protein [Siminovitchia fortis]RWR06940.1 aldehyde dehydrogenase family protein [Siminovitchia fortis]WHY82100.1 aldehyde dehydrogenase family protein [Siminovitchia fortis]
MMKLQMYINGEWKESSDKAVRDIINPANGEVIAQAAEGTLEDAEAAIKAAREAFDSGIWSDLTAAERAGYLFKIADKLEEHHEELVELEVMDNGKTRAEAEFDMEDAAACFRYYAGLITKPAGETFDVPDPNIHSMVVREPVGVAGLVVPWNFPMLMSVWKIAPALAAGNTIVFKPAEITPITAVKVFEIMEQVGIPAGAANMILGDGRVVGQAVAESHDVDAISFTGSTQTGRKIMQAATGNLKKISLELGGKSPNIIFDDVDLEIAVDQALFGIFLGAGQVCVAGSRILVQEGLYDRFVERFVERAKKIKVGPGNEEGVEMGAIVSETQMNNILNYIKIGQEEGAVLAAGGKRIMDRGLDKGFFIEPTVFTGVTQDMRIVQEEIFGPVVTIQKFKDEKEAIELANDVDYGLAGSVFTNDGARALRVIKKLRAGITWVNIYHPAFVEAPWGGYKQSGIGRGLGTYGLEDFQEVKQININLNPGMAGWFKD